MEYSRDEKRMNVEGDRLSSLPDDLIHKILSLNGLNVLSEMVFCRQDGDRHQYVISAPDLASLLCHGNYPMCHFTNSFHSLKKVDLCFSRIHVEDAHIIVHLLQHLSSVKFLTLSLEIAELLSSSVELISDQPSPFANLKSLKIHPYYVSSWKIASKRKDIANEVKNYLLDSSPNATFTLVTREKSREIIVKRNTELAQKRMENLRLMLELEKAKTETNMAHVVRGIPPTESNETQIHEQNITKLEYLTHIEETEIRIDSCWDDLNRQIEKGKSDISDIISDLHDIKEVMVKLPTSNRAELQPCFSSVCSESHSIVNQIMDYVKTLCDMKGNRFGDYIDGLATTSPLSF